MSDEPLDLEPPLARRPDYLEATDGACFVQAQPMCGMPECRHYDPRFEYHCVPLDCGHHGERTLEAVAAIEGITRERVRQIEVKALRRFALHLPRDIAEQYGGPNVRKLLALAGQEGYRHRSTVDLFAEV